MRGLLDKLGNLGLIPVVMLERLEDSECLATALIDACLPCAEITFRTSCAEEAIHKIANRFPDMIVGAGTVISVDQAKRAVGAGAHFIVSPGIDLTVTKWCIKNNVVIIPGIATPTDILLALAHGLQILKFFPAEAFGGVKTLKALGAPFSQARFIPTGGISLQNLAEYISLPMVHACGGSWIVERKLIREQNFIEITRLSSEALSMIRKIRAKGE